MTRERNPSQPRSICDFLAGDFARMEDVVAHRCRGLEGRRLYLSGATGFFGTNLLALFAYLKSVGVTFEVTALSRSPESFLTGNPWYRGQGWLNWLTGDVEQPWPGQGQYDVLIHAATDTSAAAHVDKVRMFLGIVNGAHNAAQFAATHGVRRLLLCGSGAQYSTEVVPEAPGFKESDRTACDASNYQNSYGEAKRASELIAALYSERHGIEVINTRCFAFVGPALDLHGHFAVGNFLAHALAGNPVRLNTRGESVRSYLYGADLAIWLVLLALEGSPGMTVNVGSDIAVSILDLARRVRDLVNPKLPVETGEREDPMERRFYVPDISRARLLHLQPWTGLDHSVLRTADWHRGIAVH